MDRAEPSRSLDRPALPATGLAAAYVAVAALPLAIAASSAPAATQPWREFGSACGLIALSLMALQFFSSGRFEVLSGRIGIDRTMGFHRISALFLAGVVVLHPLAYVAPTLLTDPPAGMEGLVRLLSVPSLASGVVSLALIGGVVAFALLRNRSFIRYEFWRASHGALALVVLFVGTHHAMRVGHHSQSIAMQAVLYGLVAVAALSFVITSAVRPVRCALAPWIVLSVVRRSPQVVEVLLREQVAGQFSFRAGQFVWLWPRRGAPWFTDHPLSIASSPEMLPHMRLLVREAGDGTRDIAAFEPGRVVSLDGPHGSFQLDDAAKGPVLLIAGGVGIAPILGILEHAAASRDCRAFHLLFCGRDLDSLAALAPIEDLKAELDLRVTLLVEQAGGRAGLDEGRIDGDHLARFISGVPIGEATALLCGPPAMMELAADFLIAAGMPPNQIHYERFDYGAGRGFIDRQRRRRSLWVLAFPAGLAVLSALRALVPT